MTAHGPSKTAFTTRESQTCVNDRENGKRLTVGLYGGLANNLYLLARALRAARYGVVFIRERDISYAISQPVWEDCEFTWPREKLSDTANYTAEQWTKIEKHLGWKAPDWLWDPLGKSADGAEFSQLTKLKLGFSHTDAAIMRKMRECDALITSGVKASILAYHSGVPYVVQPHGGDLMIAAGLLKVNSHKTLIERLVGNGWERGARAAFEHARAIAVHNEYLDQSKPLGSGSRRMRSRLSRFGVGRLATYTQTQSPRTLEQRRKILDKLAKKLNFRIPAENTIVFVPSRVDFVWKGQDRLLKAIKNSHIRDKFHFILVGWGEDFAKMKAMCTRGTSSVSFLPFVLSKPLLYQLMAASDIVVDNFISGHYGATGAEAMGRGTPLMAWCEPSQYRGDASLPPVLQAETPDQIERLLIDCMDGRVDLREVGVEAYRWAVDHHSERAIADQFMKLFPSGKDEQRLPH